MGKYFGTDGVRGVAGADLTCEMAMKIGRGAAAVLTGSTGHRPRILIGKDTRQSGDMLEAALTAGLCSVGADVESLGVAAHPRCGLSGHANTTRMPALSSRPPTTRWNSTASRSLPAPATSCRMRWRTRSRSLHRQRLRGHHAGDRRRSVGRVTCPRRRSCKDYVDHLYESVNGDLSGLNVCIDCANGASAAVAQKLFPRLGAKCTFIGIDAGRSQHQQGCGQHPSGQSGKGCCGGRL